MICFRRRHRTRPAGATSSLERMSICHAAVARQSRTGGSLGLVREGGAMGSKDEPGMLVALLGLAAALYAVTWLLAGPPGDRQIPVTVPASAIEVTLSAR